jgi:starvation-inducible DNA-binding protein
MHPTRHDLPEVFRVQVVKLLNERLADVLDLGLQAKQAHWNVKGPQFLPLHELFDDLAGELAEQADDLAERITALGGTAEGTLAAISGRTTLAPYPLSHTGGRDHLTALGDALATYGKQVRQDIDRAASLGDADAADLLTGISRAVDKRLWFFDAQLQGM